MNITNFILERLDPDNPVVDFDCGDADLNNFLSNDTVKYQEKRLAVTHILTLPAGDTRSGLI
ncbi:MAG: hypothetical protein LBC47_06745 [Tannerella sp.]|jgi:hypothetical protein|nr:hypothetical protein [Tannerella sp.]